MKRKTRIILFSISGLFTLTAILLIFIFALIYFALPDLSPQYGMTSISVNNRQLYFKRKAVGLSYDRIVLSPNDNYCADYNLETDFRFLEVNPSIYYKVSNNVLHLLTSSAIQPKYFPTKVELQEVKESWEWNELKEKHKKGRLELLEVPLRVELKCD
jgi:hypothetical protein